MEIAQSLESSLGSPVKVEKDYNYFGDLISVILAEGDVVSGHITQAFKKLGVSAKNLNILPKFISGASKVHS